MKNTVLIIIAALLLSGGVARPALAQPVLAQDSGAPAAQGVPSFRDTNLKLPRWAALQGEKTYVRAGPGLRYPIKWIFRKRGLPIEIIQEFDSWRKIKDWEGGEGWVHQSLLTGARSAIVNAEELVPIFDGPSSDRRIVARAEPMVVVALERCAPAWCRVQSGSYRGWIERNFLWGIYEGEEFN